MTTKNDHKIAEMNGWLHSATPAGMTNTRIQGHLHRLFIWSVKTKNIKEFDDQCKDIKDVIMNLQNCSYLE